MNKSNWIHSKLENIKELLAIFLDAMMVLWYLWSLGVPWHCSKQPLSFPPHTRTNKDSGIEHEQQSLVTADSGWEAQKAALSCKDYTMLSNSRYVFNVRTLNGSYDAGCWLSLSSLAVGIKWHTAGTYYSLDLISGNPPQSPQGRYS